MTRIIFKTLMLFVLFAAIAGAEWRAARIDTVVPGEGPTDILSAPIEREFPIDVSVDARVELMSIIFRLAGNPEYSRGRIDSYTHDVEKHFGPFREHAVIKTAKRLRNSYGVSFDAVAGMAIHITDGFEIAERVPFEPRPETLDSRWTIPEARAFLAEARDFAKATGFAEFFAAHKALYDETTARMEALIAEEVDLGWFERFFGKRPAADFHIVIALLNGPSNYGPHISVEGREHLYAIIGAWAEDMGGVPVFDARFVPTIVHEFCHSYTNPLVEAHFGELQKAGESLFAIVGPAMRRQAYGQWETMLREALVRVCVVRYIHATEGDKAAARQARAEILNGRFIWTKRLSQLMGEYEANRDKYPTLEAFFPKIIEFFDDFAAEKEEEFKEAA